MTYAQHIATLVRDLNLHHRTHVHDIRSSFAQPELRRIVTPPVLGEQTYFAALHEIGHVVSGHNGNTRAIESKSGWSRVTLNEEGEAWNWALDNALHAPSKDAARMASDFLHSYWRNRNPSVKRGSGQYARADRRLTKASRRQHRDSGQLAFAV